MSKETPAANSKLSGQVGRAAKWNVSASICVRVLGFLTTIILARILGPEEFGLFALAFVVIDGFGLFKSLGFESALVQRKDDNPVAADTAFFIIPLMGLVMYLVLVLATPYLAKGLDSADLADVLKYLGLIFIVNTLTRVPYSLLEKRMQFGKRAIADIIAQLFYSAVALTMGIMGFGVWSLVWGYLSMSLSKLVATWYMVDWRPKFRFDLHMAIDMFHFGKYMFLGSVLYFLSSNFDRIVVGRELGVGILGVYAIAYNFADLINALLGYKVSEILFPAFSKLQDNLYNLKSAYLRVVKVLLIIVFPYSMGLLFLGGEFLQTIFGEKWIQAIPVLQILSGISVMHIFIVSTKSVFNGLKRPRLALVTGIIRVSLYCLFIIPVGKAYGVKGVACMVVVSGMLATAFCMYKVSRMLSFTARELYDHLKPSIFATSYMVVAICAGKYLLEQVHAGHPVIFVSCTILGVAVYGFAVYKKDRDIIYKVKSMVGM